LDSIKKEKEKRKKKKEKRKKVNMIGIEWKR
jgi:hypothetical protein